MKKARPHEAHPHEAHAPVVRDVPARHQLAVLARAELRLAVLRRVQGARVSQLRGLDLFHHRRQHVVRAIRRRGGDEDDFGLHADVPAVPAAVDLRTHSEHVLAAAAQVLHHQVALADIVPHRHKLLAGLLFLR